MAASSLLSARHRSRNTWTASLKVYRSAFNQRDQRIRNIKPLSPYKNQYEWKHSRMLTWVTFPLTLEKAIISITFPIWSANRQVFLRTGTDTVHRWPEYKWSVLGWRHDRQHGIRVMLNICILWLYGLFKLIIYYFRTWRKSESRSGSTNCSSCIRRNTGNQDTK